MVFIFVLIMAGAQVVGAESPGSQVWYLTSESKPDDAPLSNDGLEHAKDNLMNKGSRTGTGTSFNLASDQVAWFYADFGAECDLGFGASPWEAHIRTEGIEDDEIGYYLTVEICKLNNDTGEITVLAKNSTMLTEVESGHLWNITCEGVGVPQDFKKGDWLALRLSWNCSSDSLRVYYKAEEGSDSFIESPISDPGYPVPELSTLVLFCLGLVALFGYKYSFKDKKGRQ